MKKRGKPRKKNRKTRKRHTQAGSIGRECPDTCPPKAGDVKRLVTAVEPFFRGDLFFAVEHSNISREPILAVGAFFSLY